MRVLITSGSTQIPIDQVRVISNVFKGRTGFEIANHFIDQGDNVTFLTSNDQNRSDLLLRKRWYKNHPCAILYKTYDELYANMEDEIRNYHYDLIIHSSAVSDYKVAKITNADGEEQTDGKVSSKHKHLVIHLAPTEKIIDKIKGEWGFKGTLVQFKLEVARTDEELCEIARKSMKHSGADIIVANCIEWSKERAYIGTNLAFLETSRVDLPRNLRQIVGEIKYQA